MEVQRFPGIGFSSCVVHTFNCIQGISDGGYESSFWNVLEQRKCTRMFPSTSMRVSETEVQSVMTRSTPGPDPGPIPDVSSRMRSASRRVT